MNVNLPDDITNKIIMYSIPTYPYLEELKSVAKYSNNHKSMLMRISEQNLKRYERMLSKLVLINPDGWTEVPQPLRNRIIDYLCDILRSFLI